MSREDKAQSGKGAHRYRLRRFRGRPTVSVISSPREFSETIDRECERADRYHGRFSMAVFEVGTRDENSVLIRRLVRTVHSRFRNTDDLGWYSRRQIGVIMPFTPSEGAWKLAEYVTQVVASIISPPPFTIYSYPSENWPRKGFFEAHFPYLNVLALIRQLVALAAPRAEEFHAMIARERGRADRNGNVFSLVIFKLAGMPPGISHQRRLLVSLGSRLRDTDELGWYDELHLGAILPYAPEDAARRIAESVCRSVSVSPGADVFVLYTYPQSWFSGHAVTLEPRAAPEGKLSEAPVVSDAAANEGSEGGAEVDKVTVERRSDPTNEPFLYTPIPVWKRALDIVGSLIAILVLTPLFLLMAVWVKLVSPGPILFRQERVGYMRKPFQLLKFRTMEVNVDASVHSEYVRKLIVEDSESKPMTKQDNNPHIIRMGRPIRASCIDELPQLINVFRGDMSLVGPRPCLEYEAEEYLRWHARRFDSIPGMTGLWQVEGKNRTTFKEMIRLDISYAQNRSLFLDLKILLMTVPAIIRQVLERRGAARVAVAQVPMDAGPQVSGSEALAPPPTTARDAPPGPSQAGEQGENDSLQEAPAQSALTPDP